jgi:hypothetical protein
VSDSGIMAQEAQWSAPAHVNALTTFRIGGVSTGPFHSLNLASHVGDDLVCVEENRTRLLDQLGLPLEPIWLQQAHGRRVVRAEFPLRGCVADGSFSRQPGIVCAVLTADCIPLFLTDKLGGLVGLLHVGWRGLAAGVVESGLAALDAKPQELLAWLGPGIGRDAFVVGGEVYRQLTHQIPAHVQAFDKHGDKWRADLGLMIEQRLQSAGVAEIGRSEACTATDSAAWFSHRRDGRCGRMASLIWLT